MAAAGVAELIRMFIFDPLFILYLRRRESLNLRETEAMNAVYSEPPLEVINLGAEDDGGRSFLGGRSDRVTPIDDDVKEAIDGLILEEEDIDVDIPVVNPIDEYSLFEDEFKKKLMK